MKHIPERIQFNNLISENFPRKEGVIFGKGRSGKLQVNKDLSLFLPLQLKHSLANLRSTPLMFSTTAIVYLMAKSEHRNGWKNAQKRRVKNIKP